MYIHEAVRQAIDKGACITLPEFERCAKIEPTDGKENCILMNADGSNPSKYGWQPSAEELTRDDWIIVS